MLVNIYSPIQDSRSCLIELILKNIIFINGGDFEAICYSGRFCTPKNPFFLLDVFTEISKRLPDATLAWVGSGSLFEAVRQKAIEAGVAGKIDFMGIRSDVNEILS